MTNNKLQKVSQYEKYEDEVLVFVADHYDELKENWEQWLANNPLPQDLLANVSTSDKIRLSNIARYKIEIDSQQKILFQELSAQDPEWLNDTPKIHIETIQAANSLSSSKQTNLYKIELVGIIHYLESYSENNSVLLHFDYLIAKTEVADKPEQNQLSNLPNVFVQQTFIEARSVSVALADGPRLIGWESITGEIGLRHVVDSDPMQTRILLNSLQEWHLPKDCEELKKELQNLELASLLLLNVAIGCVLEKAQMTASIDDLIQLIGWRPRSRSERLEMRRKLWRWLLLFDSMSVHGKRPGKYRDKLSGSELNLTSSDALIKVTGKRFQKDCFQDELKEIPLEVSWVAGPWLEQWRGNTQVLHYFGDLRKIASIATGKASGAWAQSIGLALHQFWRERAKTAEIFNVGEKNQLTAKMATFTRLELLSLFRCEPWVEDLLNSDKPHRAKNYWTEAIRKLKVGGAGIIGHYRELETSPQTRKGWEDIWLKYQQIDIRPRGEDVEAIAKISKANSRLKHKFSK